MREFLPYVEHLESLVAQAPARASDWLSKTKLALDGEPGRNLARLVSLESRRNSGAFFTGSILAQKAVTGRVTQEQSITVFDPTCGAGDLLLAAANKLPIRPSLPATLAFWGSRLAGSDSHIEFVRAAKARLTLLALQRGAHPSSNEPLDLNSILPLIKVGDSLRETATYAGADWILVNPPYGYVVAPPGCAWGAGKITAAALFFEKCLQNCATGTRITAILPEVLRSGSRYERWRQMVAVHSRVHRVEPYGLFDSSADIDVFILEVTKRTDTKPHSVNWGIAPTPSSQSIADAFAVHVGAVVPHRHKQQGPLVAYVHARGLTHWTEVRRLSEKRRFTGRLFQPPFVVIRRTSRPEETHRAIGTIITGKRPVAVENHLIVCLPLDQNLARCQKLLRQLKGESASRWLNTRIRCRHLTVTAIRELPWSAR